MATRILARLPRRCAVRASGRFAPCHICSTRRCSTRFSASSRPCAGSSADSKHAAAFRSWWSVSLMERLPTVLERDLFFVVQEALLNVVRHSGSDSAEVRLERHATQVILQIRDRGRGISGARPAGATLRRDLRRRRYPQHARAASTERWPAGNPVDRPGDDARRHGAARRPGRNSSPREVGS